MRIALLAKPQSQKAAKKAAEVAAALRGRGHETQLEESAARLAGVEGGVHRDELGEDADLAVVLGGDGTLLLGARTFGPKGVPILGVNMGRLGFLTDVGVDGMDDVVESVLAGEYAVEERLMLSAEVTRPDDTSEGPFLAFNDIVVNKGALAQVIRLENRVDGNFVSNFLADGLIIASPTGSTAYGLAVGGPIIVPTTEVFLVAPICPHMLTNRPIIVPAASTVECRLMEARGDVYLTIDGQEGFPLFPGDGVRVRRAAHKAKLVKVASQDFFSILRTKMGWGGA
ncbi:MAG: NAD(+)/NADH kinase [Deltaproteobacteria bacterium]|nr:NAD(+)/NADH kinase [Deltaproteobacteria bacterium]